MLTLDYFPFLKKMSKVRHYANTEIISIKCLSVLHLLERNSEYKTFLQVNKKKYKLSIF